MTGDAIVRRLTAIMFTDVVGYSKLMSTDERRALDLLHRQRELFTPLITAHHGTLHKEIGDGTLSSFDSAVDALHCARAIQAALATLGPEETFDVRIGLHTGDVVFEGNDVFGDGVNVASRIEALAPAGGVALSGPFYGAVRSQRDLTVHSLGEQALKNIAQPVPVFVLGEAPAARPDPRAAALTLRLRRWAIPLVVALVAATLAWMLADRFREADEPAADAAVATLPARAPTAAVETPAIQEQSIAVLPFLDLSENRDQEYFSDGLSEELIDQLVRIPGLLIPARTSSFYFKGKQTTIRDIAAALGVAHILEGSVRKSGNTVRITAQLIRADNGYHLWSETFERPLTDVFKVQDEIAGNIVQALRISLLNPTAPNAVPTTNADAHSLYLKARALRHRAGAGDYVAAVADLQQALALDPNYAAAWANLSFALTGDLDWHGVAAGGEPCARGRAAAERALQLDPALVEGHLAMARIIGLCAKDPLAAEAEIKRAHELGPGDAEVLAHYAWIALKTNQRDKALRYAQESVARDPLNPWHYYPLAEAQGRAGQFSEAEATLRKAVAIEPTPAGLHALHANSLLALNDPAAALAANERERDEQFRQMNLPIILDALGRKADAEREIAVYAQKYADHDPGSMAIFYACRNDAGQALAWLDRMLGQNVEPTDDVPNRVACYRNIAKDPRFAALFRKWNKPVPALD